MFYHDFDNNFNMVWPSPSWSAKDLARPFSTTTPTSEDMTGAMDHSLWSEIGDTFLVKSNITNWFKCSPNGGNLVSLTEGNLSCGIVKSLVDDASLCGGIVVPYYLRMDPCGPAVYTDDFYFFFESRDQACWPVADPCGRRQENHIHNVDDPASWLYLK